MTQRSTLCKATQKTMGLRKFAYKSGKLQLPSTEQELPEDDPEDDTQGTQHSRATKDGQLKPWHLQNVTTVPAESEGCQIQAVYKERF